MLFDQGDEICRRIPGQRRLREMWVPRNKILRRAINIGEIASSPAGNENFLSDAVGVLQNRDAPSALSRLDRAQ